MRCIIGQWCASLPENWSVQLFMWVWNTFANLPFRFQNIKLDDDFGFAPSTLLFHNRTQEGKAKM